MSKLSRLEDRDPLSSLYDDNGKLKQYITIIDGEEVIVDGNEEPIDVIGEMDAVEYFRKIENEVFN